MPKPYPADLRERVLLACERKEHSQAEMQPIGDSSSVGVEGNHILQPKAATMGPELAAFFRASPLVGTELTWERDRSVGRPLDFWL